MHARALVVIVEVCVNVVAMPAGPMITTTLTLMMTFDGRIEVTTDTVEVWPAPTPAPPAVELVPLLKIGVPTAILELDD